MTFLVVHKEPWFLGFILHSVEIENWIIWVIILSNSIYVIQHRGLKYKCCNISAFNQGNFTSVWNEASLETAILHLILLMQTNCAVLLTVLHLKQQCCKWVAASWFGSFDLETTNLLFSHIYGWEQIWKGDSTNEDGSAVYIDKLWNEK